MLWIDFQNAGNSQISHQDVAAAFMRPSTKEIVRQLVNSGQLTPQEACLCEVITMSHDIYVEADSGEHTDQGIAYFS
jgi:trans-AT polyketide synthase/acyltransferase/oxidoreductase domain-containing protein